MPGIKNWIAPVALSVMMVHFAAGQTAPVQPGTGAVSLGQLVTERDGSLFRAEISIQPPTPRSPGESGGSGDAPASNGPPGSYSAVSFFSVAPVQPKLLHKHDLVTVIAKEISAFTSNGNEALTKKQDYDSQLNGFVTLHASNNTLASVIAGATNVPSINFQNSRDYTGTGEVDRTDTLSDRFTAEVVDVKPNGTVVLQAIKQIRTDEENMKLVLTGICRAEDIAADNSVLTTQLFDLQITQTHTGAVSDSTSRGLIPRLLDTFSPF